MEEEKLYYFLVNPVAGCGKGKKRWRKVERYLIQVKIPYQVYFTQGVGDGFTHIYKRLTESESLPSAVIAVGGDGTANEIINGILKSGRDVPFGLIPAGSGNDLVGYLHIKNWKEALTTILVGKISAIDVGMVNGTHFFVNGIGAGFDGEVAHHSFNSPMKKVLNRIGLGKLIYLFSFFSLFWNYKRSPITIRTEKGEFHFNDTWMVVVGNHPTYGGGMKICPGARSDDGLFMICVIVNLPAWKFLILFPRVYFGTHIYHPNVIQLEVRNLEIETKDSLMVHIDGEVGFNTPLKIEILPSRLKVYHSVPSFADPLRSIKGVGETKRLDNGLSDRVGHFHHEA